jgi:hypothetical protein
MDADRLSQSPNGAPNVLKSAAKDSKKAKKERNE